LPSGIGGDSLLVLYNLTEVSFTYSASTPGLITAITLASGASGYQYQGYNASLKPSVDFVDDASTRTMVKHRTNFLVFANDQLTKNEIDTLKNGRYVAVIQNNGLDNNAFEVYGAKNGLKIKPQKIRDLQENGAAYNLLLETPDNELEPKLPATFFITSYAASLTALQATLFIPTVTNISDLLLQVAGGDTETITGTNFYGSGSAPAVSSVQWINQATKAATTQTFTVASATSITFTSVALAAGTYKLRVTTTKGVADSTQTAVAS
jgi:hypothetical protein